MNLTRLLGVYSNVAETFSLTSPQQKVDGTLVPPTSSRGKDYGVRVTLPNGRMSLSIGAFDSYQAGTSVLSPSGFNGAYNAISDAPVVGDLSSVGRNARNVARFPQNVYSTVTSETKGYELELTANFTRAWRTVLNVGHTKAKVRDQYPDIIAYFKSQDAISRQILADAGILIESNLGPDTTDVSMTPDTKSHAPSVELPRRAAFARALLSAWWQPSSRCVPDRMPSRSQVSPAHRVPGAPRLVPLYPSEMMLFVLGSMSIAPNCRRGHGESLARATHCSTRTSMCFSFIRRAT